MRGKANHLTWLMFSVFLSLITHTAAIGKIIYVDCNATGANNGLSWEDAVNSLQDALLAAYFSDGPIEIRVAQGVYTPDMGIGITPGDRNVSFQLINNVAIKGGYAGIGSHDPNACDITLYESILTDNLNSNNADISGSSDLKKAWIVKARPHPPSPEDDTFRIVTGSGTNDTAVLDGFTITAGDIERSYYERCAGMYIDTGRPTVTNCTFSRNSARNNGGGIFCVNNSHPIIINCTFTLNNAQCGGGMCNYDSNPTLTNCKFIENSTTVGTTGTFNIGGGGVYNRRSNPILTGCIFGVNYAGEGAGMFNYESTPVLTYCTFSGNTGYYGAGMVNAVSNPVINNCIFSGNFVNYGFGCAIDGGSPTLINCIITGNHAVRYGGGIFGDNPTLVNCIVWGNTSPQISADASITFSNIQGGWPGVGNIDADPLFINSGYWADANDPSIIIEPNNLPQGIPDGTNAVWIDGDYHLKSQAGRWNPISGSWIADDVTSLCIDAGDPNNPVKNEPKPNGGRINMGAYGGTSEASKSYAEE